MSATQPEEPEQFRGKTLTPVSPKPLHYPSPSNIPILGASMEPSFNETMNQTMHQAEPLPSTAQHTLQSTNPVSVQPMDDAAASNTKVSAGAEPSEDFSSGSSEGSGFEHAKQRTTDELHYTSNYNVALGTHSATHESSEHGTLLPVVETSASLENGSIFSPHSAAADTQAASSSNANFDIDPSLPSKPVDTPTLTIDGSTNYDALIANITAAISNNTAVETVQASTPNEVTPTVNSPISSLPNNPNLPPKPPAHLTNPAGDDIRNYHLHNQKDANSTYRPPPLPNLATNGLPPAPHTYQTPISSILPPPGSAVSVQSHRGFSPADDDEKPLDAQTQHLFDQFTQFERQNVAEGAWDRFPPGSRLFVGNLVTERVTKKDVFRRFHRYGQIAQISLKQAYGFVQYMDAAQCAQALAGEQGKRLTGREMHLEISKPSKGPRQQERGGTTFRRRSRSPDYNRGGNAGRGNIDRYSSTRASPRDREYRGGRDDYRPGRSPSPRRGSRIDRYDGRKRSRSRSPRGRGAQRYNSPPAHPIGDDLSLPKRAPENVPDIQIIVVDDIDFEYVRWVDNAMKSRGVRVDVLMLNPRLSEEAVVRRQILEGVQAVVRLNRADRMKNKVPLQLFNRSAGYGSVTFDQYVDLDPTTAADLVLRAKSTHAAPPPNYGIPPPAAQPTPYAPPPPTTYGYPGQPADISRIISSLNDSNSRAPPPNATGLTPDVARLLSQMSGAPPPHQQGAYPAPPSAAHPPPGSYANPPAGTVPVQAPTQQPDIQQLLANLTNYKPPP